MSPCHLEQAMSSKTDHNLKFEILKRLRFELDEGQSSALTKSGTLVSIIIIDKFSVMATNITGPTPQVDYSKLLTSPNYFGDNIGANPVSRPKNAESGRFTTSKTTVKKRKRTTPARIYLEEDCDYLAHYCLKAYETGQVCGRTLYYVYSTFENYCMLDYVNCMERYEGKYIFCLN
ncbi:uncharacterized protein LOC116412834 [Galleria mellonella]|uniref:Uncharacterized protein LOC116412834 n=1 Tax=Galleria mellonella TaxID=7137 RepID=A0ABM3MNK9_GALME|nr:uncharacterized protein LOC116412834 [Galleria mellonella]